MNAAMDPDFDPTKLATAGDKMQSGNKNRAIVQAIPTIAGGLSTDVTLTDGDLKKHEILWLRFNLFFCRFRVFFYGSKQNSGTTKTG